MFNTRNTQVVLRSLPQAFVVFIKWKKIKGNFNLYHETEIILKAIPVVNSLFDKTDKSVYFIFSQPNVTNENHKHRDQLCPIAIRY